MIRDALNDGIARLKEWDRLDDFYKFFNYPTLVYLLGCGVNRMIGLSNQIESEGGNLRLEVGHLKISLEVDGEVKTVKLDRQLYGDAARQKPRALLDTLEDLAVMMDYAEQQLAIVKQE